ncbi:hypothetical protein [Bradyrhizobium sp. AUGA SZCCT0431]|uniref:hypothetical protein n=1 Tax=Bradyrhizobium sp. AUGA SZCCT0431 TaxID=2807674 RepID=UPI001BAE2678|nr:hypothetical protein [Bradyrhizobium sp. AUGA SZCCT0431]MBR1143923.1 hypothetical protein [Bradyrhizobium sp. AUGA SZCCT0431]
MGYFPDESTERAWARYAVLALPLLYLIVALTYSAYMAPWGRQVDPESAYAMNGLAWAAGYPMMKNDHPGTTTILLGGIVMKLYAFISGRSDIIEFGLKNYDAFIHASRAVEALLMSLALLASGLMVQRVTRSAIAAVLFQVGPFVHFELMHFELMLTPESLMISCVVLGTGLVLKSALGREPPTAGLGVAQGLVFALGLSSKYLYAPLAILSVALLRSWRAYVLATLVGAFGFFVFNRILNPYVFTSGFHWLVSIATHKGIYGAGEPGFIDFNLFWSNMARIIAASPLISAVFVLGGCVALARMLTSRDYLNPVSLTLLACFVAFAAQLLATSKHFNLHYMVASWTLTGGVLVLSVIEMRRLWPALSPRLLAGAAGLICIALLSTSLIRLKDEAVTWSGLNRTGARLSQAVVSAAPTCANVSSMFVRAPENGLNHGADMTLGTPKMIASFSEAYARAFKEPLLDHNFYRNILLRNFIAHSYDQLAREYPCIVVRTSQELNARTSGGLLELRPDHCVVESIHVYTVGMTCRKIQDAMAK